MPDNLSGSQIRAVLLEIVNEMSGLGAGQFQQGAILREAEHRLKIRGIEYEQALLTFWQDLFRNGYLSWGYNLSNPDPPFCHLTEQGASILRHLSRDPANPAGYTAHLATLGPLSEISFSYVEEALESYNASRFKSAAVMIGAAAEILILELRDLLVKKREEKKMPPVKGLADWKTKTILDAIRAELDVKKDAIPKKLRDSIESYWPAITHQIRTVRNDAGHPSDIANLTPETVQAAMLLYPELVRVAFSIEEWIRNEY